VAIGGIFFQESRMSNFMSPFTDARKVPGGKNHLPQLFRPATKLS
jgi:hypothetical protein